MNMNNKVTLIGNLGQHPEIVEVGEKNHKRLNLSIATSATKKTGEGKYERYTEWHRIVSWGKLAENMAKYLEKGSKVAIEGKLSSGHYVVNGERRYYSNIEVLDFMSLSSRTSPMEIKEESEVKPKASAK